MRIEPARIDTGKDILARFVIACTYAAQRLSYAEAVQFIPVAIGIRDDIVRNDRKGFDIPARETANRKSGQ